MDAVGVGGAGGGDVALPGGGVGGFQGLGSGVGLVKPAGGGQGLTPVLPVAWIDLVAVVPTPLLAALVAAVAARLAARGLVTQPDDATVAVGFPAHVDGRPPPPRAPVQLAAATEVLARWN